MFLEEQAPKEVFRWSEVLPVKKGEFTSQPVLLQTEVDALLISLDGGQKIPAHETEKTAILTFLSGEAEVTIDDDIYTLHEGEAIIIPPHAVHALYAVRPFQMMLVKR